MALFGNRKVAQLEKQVTALQAVVPNGAIVESTFVQPSKTSILRWRRQTEITEAAPLKAPARQGFIGDIPRGGATEFNQGYTQVGGATDRRTLMEQMQQLYVSCVWSGACVDTIARFSSAGGMSIEPNDETNQRKETIKLSPQAQKAQDLFDYVNPAQNFRQLMRGIFTDLLIYGDSFVEVVWALGEPIALYSLPCPDMLVDADEHGNVNFYVQRTETDRRAQFEPHQVIHIKFDSPRGGLYGLGPTEKNVHPITTWLFTKGLLKSIMERGNPPNVAFAWDLNMAETEIKKRIEQYVTANLGPANVGTPVNLKGDTTVHEFKPNQIAELMATLNQCRDEMCGGYGTPPAIVSIIESGSLGGGTGSSQFKNFKVNTCGPIQELVLEAFSFDILRQGFGVTDFRCTFGDVDWRDDLVVEEIRSKRLERGAWTVNRYRDDIGEPPVDGGDDAVIIQTRDVVLVKDLAAMSSAGVEKEAGAEGVVPQAVPTVPDDSSTIAPAQTAGKSDQQDPKYAKGAPRTEADDDRAFYEAWEAEWKDRMNRG